MSLRFNRALILLFILPILDVILYSSPSVLVIVGRIRARREPKSPDVSEPPPTS